MLNVIAWNSDARHHTSHFGRVKRSSPESYLDRHNQGLIDLEPPNRRCKATWKREFKLPWREAGPPYHHDDQVDSDQKVVNKEFSLCRERRQWCSSLMWRILCECWFGVQVSGFRVQDSGFRVQGSRFRVQGPGRRFRDPGFRVQASGSRVQGLGCRV